VSDSYKRYLESTFRTAFELQGTLCGYSSNKAAILCRPDTRTENRGDEKPRTAKAAQQEGVRQEILSFRKRNPKVRYDAIRPARNCHPFRPSPGCAGGDEAQRIFQQHRKSQRSGTQQRSVAEPENLLLYRKALGHSNAFDTSIIYNTSKCVLNPLGDRCAAHSAGQCQHVWNRMNQIIIDYMLELYPDPDEALILAARRVWMPLAADLARCASIRMLHNHFIVFPKDELRNAKLADSKNPNLTMWSAQPVPGLYA